MIIEDLKDSNINIVLSFESGVRIKNNISCELEKVIKI